MELIRSYENINVNFSPDGSGILAVPPKRNCEIERTAGGIVLEKLQSLCSKKNLF